MKTLFTIHKLPDFLEWFRCEPIKSQNQILARISRIELDGYFGNHKNLLDDLWELKFNDGRRIYYANAGNLQVILLIGGNKNGQKKDIKKARTLIKQIIEG